MKQEYVEGQESREGVLHVDGIRVPISLGLEQLSVETIAEYIQREQVSSTGEALRVKIVNPDDANEAVQIMIPLLQWEHIQYQLDMMRADIERLKKEVIR